MNRVFVLGIANLYLQHGMAQLYTQTNVFKGNKANGFVARLEERLRSRKQFETVKLDSTSDLYTGHRSVLADNMHCTAPI